MEDNIEPQESADAAAAFEALRREVALLKVAVGGLAAERISAPDYSDTLADITKGVSATIDALRRIAASPSLAIAPAQLARQISIAGEEARRQDRTAIHQAHEALQSTTHDLSGWLETARLASAQNWRLAQVAAVCIVGGMLLGALAPGAVVNAAPDAWAWREKRAARILDRDLWSAGERLLAVADRERWDAMTKRLKEEVSACPPRIGKRQKSRRPSGARER